MQLLLADLNQIKYMYLAKKTSSKAQYFLILYPDLVYKFPIIKKLFKNCRNKNIKLINLKGYKSESVIQVFIFSKIARNWLPRDTTDACRVDY